MYIKSFSINNFRSLLDFSLPEMEKTTIFYGDNNAGKSNILAALLVLFSSKRKSVDGNFENFYEGLAENFSNNFYNNGSEKIIFEVQIAIDSKELDVEEVLVKYLKIKDGDNIILFSGVIEKKDENTAEIFTEKIHLNDMPLYTRSLDVKEENKEITYFKDFKTSSYEQGDLSNFFARIVNPLNDCVKVIGSDRDMRASAFTTQIINDIHPATFKQFLHTLYLSSDKYVIFDKINKVFNSEPFKFGEISFSLNSRSELDIMIKENEIRLPIKHLGSGVLQILYIISSIIFYKHKIICIEELEQNLSPDRQSEILFKLQSLINNDAISDLQQIIISSHSPTFSKPEMGLVYVVGKKDGITEVLEKKLKEVPVKDSPELKNLLFEATLPPDTWSTEEWETRKRENKAREERKFRR